jgi:hypothetical protein
VSEPDETTQVEVLEIAIEEQRRADNWISHNYDNVRNKILTLLGGGLASLTFLYASGDLFIPPEIYGKIFYFAALTLILFALSRLIVALQPMHWEFTIEDRDLNVIHTVQSKLEYLKYVKERYMLVYKMNISVYELKQRLFNLSLYPLIFGVMILVVIKQFS